MFSIARRLAPTAINPRRFTRSAPRLTDVPPQTMLEGEALIHAKLTDKFAPSQLQVQDVSDCVPLCVDPALGGCGSFYAITIASQAFKGLPIVKQHKLVTETLKQEIEGIHGLQIKTLAQ